MLIPINRSIAKRRDSRSKFDKKTDFFPNKALISSVLRTGHGLFDKQIDSGTTEGRGQLSSDVLGHGGDFAGMRHGF